MLLVPLLEIGFAQIVRETAGVVTGRRVPSRLRIVGDGELRHFQDSLGTLETVNLRRLATQVQAEIHRDLAILIQDGLYVGHVAYIVEAENGAEGHNPRGRLVPTEHIVHSADEVHQKITRNTSAIFLPAAPTGKEFAVEGAFRDSALPGIPIEGLRRKVRRNRIFPSAGGIVAAQ